MNIETSLSIYLLDQFANSATLSNEYDYDWCTNIVFNRVLESYIHIVPRREDLIAITKNDVSYDEICLACICAYTISFVKMFTKDPKVIFQMSTFCEHHHYKSMGTGL